MKLRKTAAITALVMGLASTTLTAPATALTMYDYSNCSGVYPYKVYVSGQQSKPNRMTLKVAGKEMYSGFATDKITRVSSYPRGTWWATSPSLMPNRTSGGCAVNYH